VGTDISEARIATNLKQHVFSKCWSPLPRLHGVNTKDNNWIFSIMESSDFIYAMLFYWW